MSKVYIKDISQSFINFEQKNLVKISSIIKFMYNKTKNIGISYLSFELNCSYYLYVLYKKYINFRFKSKLIYKL